MVSAPNSIHILFNLEEIIKGGELKDRFQDHWRILGQASRL
jgi:hypothetical protein